jgi:hypothetical protein
MSPQSMILPHELNGLADSGLENERAGSVLVWRDGLETHTHYSRR